MFILLNSRKYLLFLAFCIAFLGGLYASTLRNATDCRVDAMFADSEIKRADIVAFRYWLRGVIVSNHFSEDIVHKNSLLVDMIKQKLVVISQLRVSSANTNRASDYFENKLSEAFDDVSAQLDSQLIEKRIKCYPKTKWHEYLAPFSLLLICLIFLLLRGVRRGT